MSDCLFLAKSSAGDPVEARCPERSGVRVLRHCTPGAVHVLVVSKEHITSADEIASSHGGIIDDLILVAKRSWNSRASARAATAWSSTWGATAR